ncbi:unnamed protein product [Mytilus edulis]|uniref:Uncharacterized protein n=1 Tax=Mytilus edulis TaxID=6550 RepID=A0A8S3R4A0_MYTED|nr:unnamed protein product [Mytilus edulis]
MESGRNRQYNRQAFKTNKEKTLTKTNYTARVIRVSDSEMESGRNRQYENTTLQEVSGSVTQKWSQAVTDSTTGRLLRRIKIKNLRKPTTLQDLSGSVTQKWIQAVTGSTVGSLRRIKKTSFRKYYTARVIRVSDSEMESGRHRQYNMQAFKTNKEKNLTKTNYTARVIRVCDTEMESGRNRQYGSFL